MSKHALIVAESMFGNTRHVAERVAGDLRTIGWTVQVLGVDSAPTTLPANLDLLVIGTPTHGYSIHPPTAPVVGGRSVATVEKHRVGLLTWLADVLPSGPWPSLAVYDTRVAHRHLTRSPGPRAIDVALERGFTSVHCPSTFLVLDTRGPLVPGELERAGEWATSLAAPANPAQVPQESRPTAP